MIEKCQSSSSQAHQSGNMRDSFNLTPLSRPLGHNGPYIGGEASPVEQDCRRIPGHSDLFRDLDRFEPDLREAVTIIWDGVTNLRLAYDRIEDGLEEPETVLDNASEVLSTAFKFMQEAYLVAEVLNDRETRRIAAQERVSFMELISTRKPEDMKAIDRLCEQAQTEWMISALLDRRAYSCGIARIWPKPETLQLMELTQRLEAALEPSAAQLQDMTDAELSETLQSCERSIAETRKRITLIHALRTVRHAQ